MKNKCILGIDTSNYRTSIALVDLNNRIIASNRQLLTVKKGDRGLQQSYALFQHLQSLPNILHEILKGQDIEIVAVAFSNKPRPVEDSYMPVFLAGETIGKSIASALAVPYYEFSHQEGHIAAAKYDTSLETAERFITFHFSGGTTECLLYEKGDISIVGGTLDLAFGQIIDRIGVKLGYQFPAGQYMDENVLNTSNKYEKTNLITHVKVRDGYFNLSGLETQLYKMIDKEFSKETITKLVFDELISIIDETIKQLSQKYNINDFLFAGGVSSSEYIRNNLTNTHNLYFAREELSGDNAVGIALLGGKLYGQKACNNNTIK